MIHPLDSIRGIFKWRFKNSCNVNSVIQRLAIFVASDCLYTHVVIKSIYSSDVAFAALNHQNQITTWVYKQSEATKIAKRWITEFTLQEFLNLHLNIPRIESRGWIMKN
jgi:hypothetical protein